MGDLAKLTDGQRECLKRVLVRKNSKEIALELGISPHTVDQRLRVAIQTLGVTTRFEAARRLADHESGEAYQPGTYQSLPLAHSEPPVEPAAHAAGGDQADDRGHEGLKQDGLSDTAPPHPAPQLLSLRLPARRGGRNDLSLWARAGWIVALASGTAVAFGTFLTGIKALADLATASG